MLIDTLRNVPLFHALEQEQLESVIKHSMIRDYRKYEMVLFEGQPEVRFFLILNGRVKISRYTREGEEAVFAFLGERDLFGELCVFENEIRESNVITIESSRLLIIHRIEFLQLLNQISQININLLREMTLKIRRRNEHIRSMTTRNATGKLAGTILSLADEYGTVNYDQIEISRMPTHRDIASMVGTSRETISRALKELSRRGYIRRERNKLVICNYHDFRTTFSG